MQINRLFEIVYLLLAKKNMTTKELAAHFEVSTRTIFRDIDTLSGAGIPIYTTKGKGGGVSLLDEFVLNKSVLTDKEQQNILSALQGLQAVECPDSTDVLTKLGAIFNKNLISWIDIDFSPWGSDDREKEKFLLLRDAILACKEVSFDYFDYYDKQSQRVCEPLQIIFKGKAWYLSGFCKEKNDYRLFKLSRLRNLEVSSLVFKRREIKDTNEFFNPQSFCIATIKIDRSMHFRVRDEFHADDVRQDSDGNFIVKTLLPDDEWGCGVILSYADKAEVISPNHLRKNIKEKLTSAIKTYI